VKRVLIDSPLMDKNQLGMDRLLQDLWLRERNIVFPDTVRNEGNFYRNLARRDQSRDALQRVGTMMLAIPFLMTACFFLVMAVGFLVEHGLFALIPAIIGVGAAIVSFAIGARLAIAAVFTVERPVLDERLIRRRRLMGRR
jgi:hypothetical protein